MTFIKGFFIFIGGLIVVLLVLGQILKFTEGDTSGGSTGSAMQVQRLLVADHLGWDRRAITAIGHSQGAVSTVGSNLFHVQNWYETRLTTARVNYKMIVRYQSANDTYSVVCFSADVDYPRRDCF